MFTDGDSANLSANLSFPCLSLSIWFLSTASLPPEDRDALERAEQGFERDFVFFPLVDSEHEKRALL